MKVAWAVLLISALTDFLINSGTSLMAAMMATGSAAMPSSAVILVVLIGGVVQAARTIQQALKVTPEISAALRGNERSLSLEQLPISVSPVLPSASVKKG